MDSGGGAMSFRRRLLLLFAVTVLVSVTVVAWIVSTLARRAFDRANDERTAATVEQFRREFSRRGEDVSHRIQAALATPEANRIALAAAQTTPDYAPFLDSAQTIAETQHLDFLEFADDRATIISSAQWPAKFGYKEALANGAAPGHSFLKEEETPNGSQMGLFAVHSVATGDHTLYIIGGVRLDRSFLSSLEVPAGMRVMLYENLQQQASDKQRLITSGETPNDAAPVAQLIQSVERDSREHGAIVRWSSGDEETVNAFPLMGDRDQVLGVLLVGSSRAIYNELRNQIRSAALLAIGAGFVLAVILSGWAAARVTRPVESLARAAHEVAAGNWDTQVNADREDELGQLADSFNRMTRELIDSRERLVQAERVAAWRELARRLAHELKNPLFPLQLTVENLLRSHEQGGREFEDTFRESAATLLSEIANLKGIIGRFSDFSRMPQPNLQKVSIDEIVEQVAKVHQPQLQQAGVECRLELGAKTEIAADADLLHRALSNLVLNAIDAMPKGGTLTLKTTGDAAGARIQVSDTGVGLKPEECERLFTPYYTSKAHGTGLGLAIVQSIVSDHGGRISVSSKPDEGTTFMIELPSNREKLTSAEGTHV
jgi:two-component system, NtrC family, nitrogen regulation sensor histidine kinase NtrY